MAKKHVGPQMKVKTKKKKWWGPKILMPGRFNGKVRSLGKLSSLEKALLIEDHQTSLKTRFLIESKKLWQIAGPSIFRGVASYSMIVVTQAFAGHLGDVELASISIANTVIVGFNIGLLVSCLARSFLSKYVVSLTY